MTCRVGTSGFWSRFGLRLEVLLIKGGLLGVTLVIDTWLATAWGRADGYGRARLRSGRIWWTGTGGCLPAPSGAVSILDDRCVSSASPTRLGRAAGRVVSGREVMHDDCPWGPLSAAPRCGLPSGNGVVIEVGAWP